MMRAQRDADLLKPGGDGSNQYASNGLETNPLQKRITLSEVGIAKNLADRARGRRQLFLKLNSNSRGLHGQPAVEAGEWNFLYFPLRHP
jgi:hypothetical protein